MAPEVVRLPRLTAEEAETLRGHGIPLYDEKVDVWSVGCLTFELLMGRECFLAADAEATMERILNAPVELDPRVPVSSAAAEFVAATLQRRAERRPSMAELLQARRCPGPGSV